MREAAPAPPRHRTGPPPALDLEATSLGRPILVLAPHPDDESLGCGALLAAAFDGPGAHVACLTDGSRSHRSADFPPRRLAELRRAELEAAVAALGGGGGDVTTFGRPDGHLAGSADGMRGCARDVAALADRTRAHLLLATCPLDRHPDHVATARIALAVARERPDLRLLFYPIWARWEDPALTKARRLAGAMRYATAARRGRKERAIAAHASQLGRVVTDDPDGFVMPPEFVDLFRDGDEIFLEAASWA